MNIFVSYTAKDTEVTLKNLYTISTRLKLIGNVYIDVINNDSINKQERVFKELDNSDILILLESPNVYRSKWVLLELEVASNKLIPIIPFTIAQIKTLSIEEISLKLLCSKNTVRKNSQFGVIVGNE